MNADLSRIEEFEHGSLALVAGEVTSIPEGWVARTPSLPLVWSLNHVGLNTAIETDAALALLERHMDGLSYRHLVVQDEPSGRRLAGGLGSGGWKVERDVLMALTRQPDRGPDTGAVIEAGEEEALELMARWVGESEEPPAVREVIEATRLTWRARNARRFGVIGRDGQLAGMTMLFSDGAVAQVEDVYVVPGERGRGLGRALVTHAVVQARAAGHELTFIAADDDGWPKDLYARVGFAPVARVWVFHRPAG